VVDNEELRMTERKSPGKRHHKTPALFRNPLFDEKPSSAKRAVWTGRVHKEGFEAFDAVDVARLRALVSVPPVELLEDRAERIQRKTASWDRDKLEACYARTLLSALLLRNSQRMLAAMLPALNALAEQEVAYEELCKTARLLALYANMLLKRELPAHYRNKRGGDITARQKRTKAQRRHDQWLQDFDKLAASGRGTRNIAATLANRHGVESRTIRRGLKEAMDRANQGRQE
jgi:C4-dicarboxylate-specific signal transduction histidine kinase